MQLTGYKRCAGCGILKVTNFSWLQAQVPAELEE